MGSASKCSAALVLAFVVLATAGCTRYAEGASASAGPDLRAAAKSGELKCVLVDAPLTEVERVDADEPTLKVPVPEGWTRVTGNDTDLLRFHMVNRNLSTMDIPATAVAALESVPEAMAPAAVFDAERASLVSVGVPPTSMKITDHEVCGLPAQTVEYVVPDSGPVPAHPGIVVFVAYQTKLRTYCAGITVQSTQPDNLTYQRQADLIIKGFQVLAPQPT